MGRIAKKPRSVKGQKAGKPAPRYSIRKDSLNRRYAIDKRTGKRVAVSKADKERQKRKKAAQQFRGIKPEKAPKAPKAVKAKRAAAAKKGWETRRGKKPELTKAEKKERLHLDLLSGKRKPEDVSDSERPTPEPAVFQLGALIPEGMRMRTIGGLVDRMEIFPKVKDAAENAWNRLQHESWDRLAGKAVSIEKKSFDQDHGKGIADYIRYEVLARARDIQDVEQLIENIVDTDDDYSSRELYTLFFSPDVA